jgi:hypothetical protein
MGAFRKRNGNGRHARPAPAPQPAPQPAPPPARPPVTLGAGAYLRGGAAPDAGPAFTGLRTAPGEPLAAVICLGAGWAVDVTRTLWLDDLSAAARDARDALARDRREAEIRAAREPRFLPAAVLPDPEGGQM